MCVCTYLVSTSVSPIQETSQYCRIAGFPVLELIVMLRAYLVLKLFEAQKGKVLKGTDDLLELEGWTESQVAQESGTTAAQSLGNSTASWSPTLLVSISIAE